MCACCSVYGGEPYGRQISRLQKGVDVVVGTPGRLLDLIERKSLDLSMVPTVVLDEADEMLSMGFIEDIESILKETPSDAPDRPAFGHAVADEIRRLADRYMRNPQSIATEREQVTVAAIEQRHYVVHETDKLAALTRLFEVEPITSALIFVRTRAGAGELAAELSTRGFAGRGAERRAGTGRARAGAEPFPPQSELKVLVATDVAARGLDIDHISHVFNFDLPEDPEIYVHRIGRTGRAGKIRHRHLAGGAAREVAPEPHRRLCQAAHSASHAADGRTDRGPPRGAVARPRDDMAVAWAAGPGTRPGRHAGRGRPRPAGDCRRRPAYRAHQWQHSAQSCR